MLSIGTLAPDFELYSAPYEKIKLSAFEGKKIILAFYPADWSPVCGDQMSLYNEMLELFAKYNAELIGISVDSKWCHHAFSENRNFHFALLADFEPKGAVSKLYEAYDAEEGASSRSLFVIDENRIIQWNYLAPKDTNPGADGILDALEKLSH